MAIQQKLHTKLVQKLILTPSLQQAIKLLPMSTLELGELLTQEMVENPLLEEIPSEDLQATEAAAAAEKPEEAPKEQKTDSWDDQDYEYFFGDYLDDGYRPRAPQEVKELPPIENTLSTSTSLSDHLLWQLSIKSDDDVVREIGTAIVGNLDDDGYLVASVDEIAAMGSWPIAEVERALRLVQSFDPIGVAARDLQECLWLQMRHLGLEGTPTERIVTEHLRLLQNHQVPELARKLGLPIEELKQHIEVIQHLDPKPGSRYNPPQSQYVIPDVYVVKVEDQYVAVLNEEGLPQLRISPAYRRLLDKGAENSDETRAYVKDKFRSALWLIKSVEQRQKTIYKVATSIVNFQRDFLDHGIEHLRPLVLRDVANDIGMHESTVSRVVTNKYMHTPQGVFEMKFFFHSGISSSYGESVSSVTIKQRIRKIIENEDPHKPLSDSKIVSLLQKEGLVLARRTIAKYREELKIPTSNQRKVLYLTAPYATRTDRPATSRSRPRCGSRSRRSWPSSTGSCTTASCPRRSSSRSRSTATSRTSPCTRAGDQFLHGLGASTAWETSINDGVEKLDAAAPEGEGQVAGAEAPRHVGPRAPPRRRGAGGAGAEPPPGAPRCRATRSSRCRSRRPRSAWMSGDDAFLVFRNAATDSINVVYRRKDGHLGLIEPEG